MNYLTEKELIKLSTKERIQYEISKLQDFANGIKGNKDIIINYKLGLFNKIRNCELSTEVKRELWKELDSKIEL